MMEINHWLLPDGVQDLLPDDTAKLEVCCCGVEFACAGSAVSDRFHLRIVVSPRESSTVTVSTCERRCSLYQQSRRCVKRTLFARALAEHSRPAFSGLSGCSPPSCSTWRRSPSSWKIVRFVALMLILGGDGERLRVLRFAGDPSTDIL